MPGDSPTRRRAAPFALGAAFAAMLASAAAAQSGRVGWDGTWFGGWQNNAGVQITFVGDKLISFYWRDDYQDILRADATPEGRGMAFAWSGGEATLARDAGGTPVLRVRERGRPEVAVRLQHQ